jgi:hypothetical protein
MHILGAKSFARFLESKKLNAFRVEAHAPHLNSRTIAWRRMASSDIDAASAES